MNLLMLKELWATWWRALLGAAVVAGPCFLLGQCVGADHARDQAEASVAIATVEALKTDGAAKERAAGERLADAEAVAETKKELTDAVQDLPDELPSVRRVARACAQLRLQGTDTSGLPACRGPAGQAEASARP